MPYLLWLDEHLVNPRHISAVVAKDHDGPYTYYDIHLVGGQTVAVAIPNPHRRVDGEYPVPTARDMAAVMSNPANHVRFNIQSEDD
jgi:hypothetical protein